LFVDGRFEYDGVFWKPPPSDSAFYRNTVKLSIGYEMNFLKKKKKQADPSAVWAKVIPVDGEEEQDWEREQEPEPAQEPAQEQISSEDEVIEMSEVTEISEPSEPL
jgi:hypothetical protein